MAQPLLVRMIEGEPMMPHLRCLKQRVSMKPLFSTQSIIGLTLILTLKPWPHQVISETQGENKYLL